MKVICKECRKKFNSNFDFSQHNCPELKPDAIQKLIEEDNKKKVKRFDAYEISGVTKDEEGYCEMVTDGSKADFYSLYGHIEGEGVQCIGDFETEAHALEVYHLIVGEDTDRFPVDIN